MPLWGKKPPNPEPSVAELLNWITNPTIVSETTSPEDFPFPIYILCSRELKFALFGPDQYELLRIANSPEFARKHNLREGYFSDKYRGDRNKWTITSGSPELSGGHSGVFNIGSQLTSEVFAHYQRKWKPTLISPEVRVGMDLIRLSFN
jgi:hypothetical protein